MNLKNMIETSLKAGGFDGLFNCTDYEGCACKLGDDFMPCDSPSPDCEAGYLQPNTNAENLPDFDFCIGAKKYEVQAIDGSQIDFIDQINEAN